MLWVPVTLLAAAAQVGRNAAQSGLTRRIGTLGATQVRFLFGLPFALMFLIAVTFATGEAVPLPGARSFTFALLGASAQIGATALMLVTMKSVNIAVTTAWLKTEPVLVALASALVLADPLSLPMLGAIAIATCGVLLMTLKPGVAPWRDARAALTGLAAAALFGASAICFRGSILALPEAGFLIRATTILVLSLALQTVLLLAWMALFARGALAASFGVWRQSLLAGLLGAGASQLWFLGFALTSAANVRTLALVEVIFAQGVSVLVLRQKTGPRQLAGMAVVVLGVGLLLRLDAG
jgi:drug/metabolite transporter (DMT)-like permease